MAEKHAEDPSHAEDPPPAELAYWRADDRPDEVRDSEQAVLRAAAALRAAADWTER